MATILIVDDDAQLRTSFERLLRVEGHRVLVAPSGEVGLELARREEPDLIIQDVRLPGMSGLETFRRVREFAPKLPVIVMTAFGTTEIAIEATKMGAYDYVLKPFDIPTILSLIERAVEAGRLMRARVDLEGEAGGAEGGEALVGRCPAMQELYKAIGRVAGSDATVLILGESGTGKELVARAIYHHSHRADQPFLAINCVAIPETLLESELFGYEKGAFTGAVNRRIGKIEQANRGTVLLDEIGDMPLSIQAKLLRLLQERQIERLGGKGPQAVDVRILAATNCDLEAAVREGRFREDLYYRLNVVTLRLPPLRERKDDIGLLAGYFLRRYAREAGSASPGLTPDAVALLQNRPWPGNVRELANAMHKVLIFNRGAPVEAEELLRVLEREPEAPADNSDAEATIRTWLRAELLAPRSPDLFERLMNHFGRLVLDETLTLTRDNRSQAARLLGLSRPTLLARMEKYGLKGE